MLRISGKTAARLVAGLLSAPALFWPGYAAEPAPSKSPIPDFSGVWARSTFGWEIPDSGPATLKNLQRRANGDRKSTRLNSSH